MRKSVVTETYVTQHGDILGWRSLREARALPYHAMGCGTSIARAVEVADPVDHSLNKEIWRCRKADRLVICELRRHEPADTGWDVQLLERGEVVFSKRCATEDSARWVAECFREDLVRTGFTE